MTNTPNERETVPVTPAEKRAMYEDHVSEATALLNTLINRSSDAPASRNNPQAGWVSAWRLRDNSATPAREHVGGECRTRRGGAFLARGYEARGRTALYCSRAVFSRFLLYSRRRERLHQCSGDLIEHFGTFDCHRQITRRRCDSNAGALGPFLYKSS